MAKRYTLLEDVNDITECPVCAEMMVDPKMLPCIHTICLKCLNQHWKDKQQGARVQCPVCRKKLEIPKGGIGNLQSNFSIQKRIDAQKKLSKDKTVNCDMMEFVGEQKNQITDNVDAIGKLSVEVNRQIEILELSLKKFPDSVAETEKVIMEKAEDLKRMVDDHAKVLLQKLNLLMSEYMENLTTAMKELQSQKNSLNHYAAYVGEVIKSASPSYLASVANDFNSRAAALETLKNANTEICSEITVIPSDLQEFTTAWRNLIGKIDIRENKFLSE